MSVKSKIILSLSLTFLVSNLFIYSVIGYYGHKNKQAMEKLEIESTFGKLEFIINQETKRLKIVANDWGAWDELYNYINKKDLSFELRNLTKEQIDNLSVDYIGIYNSNRIRLYNYESDELNSNRIQEIIDKYCFSNNSKDCFLYGSNSQYYIIAQSPVKNVLTKAENGKLIFVSVINQSKIDEFARILNCKIKLLNTLDNNLFKLKTIAPSSLGIEIQNSNSHQNNDEIIAISPFILSVIISLLLALALNYILKKLLIDKFSSLNNQLNDICNNNSSERINISSKDEIADIAEHINNLLDANEEYIDSLKIAESNSSALLNSSQIGFILVDKDFNINGINEFSKHFFSSYSTNHITSETEIKQSIKSFLASKNIDIDYICDGNTISFSMIIQSNLNLPNYYEILITPVSKQNPNNEICISIIPITERVEALKQVNANLTTINTIFRYSNNYIAILDQKMRIIFQSESVKQILGYETWELSNKLFLEVIKRSSVSKFTAYINRIMSSTIPEEILEPLTISLMHKNKSFIDFEISIHNARQNPAVRGFILYARSIAERKEILGQYHIVQRALESVTTAIGIVDALNPSYPLVYVNQAFETLTGYSQSEILGNDLSIIYKDDSEQDGIKDITDAVKKGTSCKSTIRNYKKNGDLYWNELVVSPISDENGNITHYVGIHNDITERIKLEQQLIDSKERAEAGDKAKSEFLTTMSHEIKTPLNGILGLATILESSNLTSELKDIVKIIKNNGINLQNILTNILEYTKLISGKIKKFETECNLYKLADEIQDFVLLKISERKIDYYTIIDPKINYLVETDISKLRELILHILSNAIKFTEKGKVIFSIKEVNRTNEFATLHFSIKDTGIGIPYEKQMEIFEPFAQIDSTNKRKFGGTGIGLAICKELIKIFDGTLWFTSETEVGSVFQFSIKFTRTIESTELLSTLNQYYSESCLVVSDDDDTVSAYTNLLESHFGDINSIYNDTFLNNIMPPFSVVIFDSNSPELVSKFIDSDLKQYKTRILVVNEDIFSELNIEKLKNLDIHLIKKPFHLNAFAQICIGNIELNPFEQEKNIATPQKEFRILVAEDNKINQKVISYLLAKLSIKPDIVSNGIDAWNAVKSKNYTIVLMDVQMPEMDGLEATKNILDDQEINEKPIIIAMTANSFQEDIDDCLNSGMSDFLPKPLELNEIENKLNHWLPILGYSKIVEINKLPNENTTFLDTDFDEKIFSIPAFNNTFDTKNEMEFALDMMGMFIIQAQDNVKDIKKYLDIKDYNSIQSTTHQLKGSSYNIGALKFHEICVEIDADLKQKNTERISVLIAELIDAADQTFNALRSYMIKLRNQQ